MFPLRIRGCNEEQRDAIIDAIFARDISVNVHFIPLPLLSFYKSEGYVMSDYPVAYDNYSREISLPLYYNLSDEDVDRVIAAVFASVEEVLKA